jgi:arylsulfatase A
VISRCSWWPAWLGLMVGAVIVSGRAQPATGAPMQRPNFVIVLADDLGWADLGCYGSKHHATPHLDRLAGQGMRFTQAYAAQAVCSPSRAALMTGRAPARLGITDYLPGRPSMASQKLRPPRLPSGLALKEQTLAELLKPAGYVSAYIGKWHLGGADLGPLAQGFDFATNAPSESAPSESEGGKSEFALTRHAIGFVEAHRDRPFLLMLGHHSPHIPLVAGTNAIARHAGAPNPTYAAMIESLDAAVGRLLERLDELGLGTNTVVVFTSDNGGLSVVEGVNTPATSNAPLRGGKGGVSEGGNRVPLIVRWPGVVPAARVTTVPVIHTDFAATLLELAGQSAPVEVAFDGASFVSVLRGGSQPVHDALFWHYPHYSNQRGQPAGAVRVGDWKLIEHFEDPHVELYHLATDPSETQDLSTSEPHRARELRTRLSDWRQRVGAPMPTPNPDYDPSAAWTTVFSAGDGTVRLPAHLAEVHGSMLRYEPPPHKNTLGYWTRVEDFARWDFSVERAGRLEIELLQGCGKGSGGAELEIIVAGTASQASIPAQRFRHIVEDTGHFQNFVPRVVGTADLPSAGRYSLTVKPRTKPGVAVGDIRLVTLRPVAR